MCGCGVSPSLGLIHSIPMKIQVLKKSSPWISALGGQRWLVSPGSRMCQSRGCRLWVLGWYFVWGGVFCFVLGFSVYYSLPLCPALFLPFLLAVLLESSFNPPPSWPCPASPILPASHRLSLLFCPALYNPPPPPLPPPFCSPGNSLCFEDSRSWKGQQGYVQWDQAWGIMCI